MSDAFPSDQAATDLLAALHACSPRHATALQLLAVAEGCPPHEMLCQLLDEAIRARVERLKASRP